MMIQFYDFLIYCQVGWVRKVTSGGGRGDGIGNLHFTFILKDKSGMYMECNLLTLF